MNNHVIIVGLGDIGYHLALNLIALEIPLSIIERNNAALKDIYRFSEVQIINDSGESYNSLIKAGVKSAKIILSTLANDSQNILVSSLAKGVNPKILTISRIRNKNLLKTKSLHKVLNIDIPLYPEEEVAKHLFDLLKYNNTREFISMLDNKVVLRGLKVEKLSYLIGMTISEIKKKFDKLNFLIAAISREDEIETIIPNGQEKIEQYDVLHIFMLSKYEEKILKAMKYKRNKIRNSMVIGAGSYGTLITEEIVKRKISSKLIELDKTKAKLLDEKLLDTIILYGDGSNKDVLRKNRVGKTDLFIAATSDGFSNIISCKLAKAEGAKNTVSVTYNKSIYNLSYMLGVDICLNPHYPVIDKVLSIYYPENIKSIKTIANEDANIIEIDIKENYPVVDQKLKDLSLGISVLVGLIKRDNILFLPSGKDYIMLNDTVFLFLSKKDINRVIDKFFKQKEK